jgi:hypothetical protein
MKDYLDIALEACTKAGDIIRENFHKKNSSIIREG